MREFPGLHSLVTSIDASKCSPKQATRLSLIWIESKLSEKVRSSVTRGDPQSSRGTEALYVGISYHMQSSYQ